MRLIGQLDDQGNLIKYGSFIEVVRRGNSLLAAETGELWGLRDRDEWVSPLITEGHRFRLEIEGE